MQSGRKIVPAIVRDHAQNELQQVIQSCLPEDHAVRGQ